jgi:hypothetical protein
LRIELLLLLVDEDCLGRFSGIALGMLSLQQQFLLPAKQLLYLLTMILIFAVSDVLGETDLLIARALLELIPLLLVLVSLPGRVAEVAALRFLLIPSHQVPPTHSLHLLPPNVNGPIVLPHGLRLRLACRDAVRLLDEEVDLMPVLKPFTELGKQRGSLPCSLLAEIYLILRAPQ